MFSNKLNLMFSNKSQVLYMYFATSCVSVINLAKISSNMLPLKKPQRNTKKHKARRKFFMICHPTCISVFYLLSALPNNNNNYCLKK